MQSQENTKPIYGGFFVRLVAYVLDLIIISLVMMPIKLPMWIASISGEGSFLLKEVLFDFSIWDIIIYLLGTLYFILMTYITGATVGKRLFNLKVISSSCEKLSLWNVIYRETLGRYLSSILFIGYIIIGVDKEKKGLHDILCDTRVIYSCKVRIEYYGSNPVYMTPPVPMMPPMQPYQNVNTCNQVVEKEKENN